MAFDSKFVLLSPQHQLEYNFKENRAFFILLNKKLNYAIQRRCFQTALQFSKVLEKCVYLNS